MDKAKLCMPVKTVTIRPNDVPWMTNEIRLLINKRIVLHNKAKLTNKHEDWQIFRQFRNHVTDIERQRQIEYTKELENKVSDRSNFLTKDWWKLVKLFLKKKGVDSNEIPPIIHNGTVYYTRLKISTITL